MEPRPGILDFTATLEQVITETADTRTFRFARPAGWTFEPGQFVNLYAPMPGVRAKRAYSIASSPLDAALELTIRRFPDGLVSRYFVDEANPGQEFRMKGPYGRFVLEPGASRLVWIAGGTGIVPFRSMWRYIEQTGLPVEFSLLYAMKSPDHTIYAEEIERLAAAGRPVIRTYTGSQPEGWTGFCRRIDRDMIEELSLHQRADLFFACGPPDMCNCVAEALTALGVPRTAIRLERYD